VYPLMPNKDWERSAVSVRQIAALRLRIKELEQQLPAKPAVE
jgi:UDP-3-O-[3-hydroxymyristoyl] glucosamine N-acyltransferase